MSKTKFKLNYKGVRELLKSQEMKAVIEEHTNRVLQNTGGASAGYEGNTQIHNRVVGLVFASEDRARKDNNANNTLIKALR